VAEAVWWDLDDSMYKGAAHARMFVEEYDNYEQRVVYNYWTSADGNGYFDLECPASGVCQPSITLSMFHPRRRSR
jgi:hypothetical protein